MSKIKVEKDGYTCRMGRWFSGINQREYTCANVTDPGGFMVMHVGYSDLPCTDESALQMIGIARSMVGASEVEWRANDAD